MAQHYLRADAGGVKQNVRERYLNYAELTEAAAPRSGKCAYKLAYAPSSTTKKPAEKGRLRTVQTTHNPLVRRCEYKRAQSNISGGIRAHPRGMLLIAKGENRTLAAA